MNAVINKRRIASSLVLSIITGGLYGLYWLFLLVKNVRFIEKDESRCVGEWACILFVPFYGVYWWYKKGKAVQKVLKAENEDVLSNGVLFAVLAGIGLSLVAMAIFQDDCNALSGKAKWHEEPIRKLIIILKRKPQLIPMLVLGIAFVLYSFGLTKISDTTARINKSGMGLAQFCTMLFSLLSFVCFMNAFPHRKPIKKSMLFLMFGMLVILLVCDWHYIGQINASLATNAANNTEQYAFIKEARSMLYAHMAIVVLGGVLTAFEPAIKNGLSGSTTTPEMDEEQQINDIILSDD